MANDSKNNTHGTINYLLKNLLPGEKPQEKNSEKKISDYILDNILEKKKNLLENKILELKHKKKHIIIQIAENQKEIENSKISKKSIEDFSSIKVEVIEDELTKYNMLHYQRQYDIEFNATIFYYFLNEETSTGKEASDK